MIVHTCEVISDRGTYYAVEVSEWCYPKLGRGKGPTREAAERAARIDLVARNCEHAGLGLLADCVRAI